MKGSTGHFRRARGEAPLAVPLGGRAGFARVAVLTCPHALKSALQAVPQL
jgi:hypothetical protein